MTHSPVNPDPVARVAAGPGLRPAPGTVGFDELLTMLGHDGFTAVCHQPVGGEFVAHVTESADAATLANVADADLWFGVNPVIRPAPRRRGTSQHVTKLSCLWVDFDVKPGACESLTQAQAIINDLAGVLGTNPAVLIWSGHGVQPLWLIDDDDAVFASHEDRARAKTVIKRWRLLVNIFAERRDAGVVDAVFDLARILRIPGTTNYKETPVPVVATPGGGGPLTLDEIDEVLDAYGIPYPDDEISGVVVDPSTYEWADKACWYAPAMITGWSEDEPTARHPWLVSQATRLAAARRRGCLTADEHRRGVETLRKRMGELCSQGTPRRVTPTEIGGALTWGEQEVSKKTDEQVARELGSHTHTSDHIQELSIVDFSPGGTDTGSESVAASTPGQILTSYLIGGGSFIHDEPEGVTSLWGGGDRSLWADGEALIICGPQGVGKTTLASNVLSALVGDRPTDVLGVTVRPAARTLYLAMDRPRQAARALRRQLGHYSRGHLDDRMTFWKGPPPHDLAKNTRMLTELAEAAQAVQVSAFPSAYAKHEAAAQAIVQKLAGLVAGTTASGDDCSGQNSTSAVSVPGSPKRHQR